MHKNKNNNIKLTGNSELDAELIFTEIPNISAKVPRKAHVFGIQFIEFNICKQKE